MTQLASENAPSPYVVVPHFVVGGVSLFIASLLITLSPGAFTQHYFNAHLLSITHLLVLGWLTMVIFGALYQLLPVILEVRLFSEILAGISMLLLIIGSSLLSFSFWRFSFNYLMFIAGSFIVIAVVSFTINVICTAFNSEKNIAERLFIVTASLWLFFTVSAGLTLALNLRFPFLKVSHLELLKLHAHAGIVGWFLQLIIGVSSKLLPMFMVSHGLNHKKLYVSYYGINAGLILGSLSLYFQLKTGVIISTIIAVIGVVFYLSFLVEAYNKRIKKQLDIGMRQSAFSYLLFIIALLLLFFLLSDIDIINELHIISIAYGSTIIIGFMTSLVMGQTYKTLPFIVWLKTYRGRVGKVILPLPKDLYSEKIATFQMWFYVFGFFVFVIGVILAIELIVVVGGVLILISALFYNLNIVKIVLHRPKRREGV